MPVKAEVGMAVGVIGTMSSFDTSGSEQEGHGAATQQGVETITGSASNDVDYGSIFVEFIAKESWAGYTIGAEYIPGAASLGTKTRTDTASATEDGATSDDSGDYTAKAEIEDHFSVYIEPTVYASEGLGLYLKGGASRVTVKSLESIERGQNSSAYGDQDVWGLLLGAGLRYTHSSGMLLKLEYAQTDYSSVTLTSMSDFL